MTVQVANVEINTDTFRTLVERFNDVADALSTTIVTANGEETTGTVKVNGVIQSNTAVQVGSTPVALSSVNFSAGSGLVGGGTLAADRTISLSSASIASLGKADTAVQPGSLSGAATQALYGGAFTWGSAEKTPTEVRNIFGADRLYECGAPAGGVSTFPSSWPVQSGILRGFIGNGTAYTVSWQELISSTSTKRWIRRASSGTDWTPWSEIYHQQSILGTVSQTGGVPTGAIIERGANANGSYLRMADGTQICWHGMAFSAAVNIAAGSLYRSAALYWTFPAEFNAASYYINGNMLSSDDIFHVWVQSFRAPSTTGSQFVLAASDNLAAATRNFSVVAIGRWF